LGRRFQLSELADLFDVVVASGDIGYAKPEAAAYEITADRLGVRLDECVFVDDREPYCEAARGVGMQAIVYRDFAQFQAELQAMLA
jgi:HAD superfamily hydrolase (TIGR01509 family)